MDEPPPSTRKPCSVCDAPGGWHCTKCKSQHYCSKACQRKDWYERGHKAACVQLAHEFQDRLLDELMPPKLKIKDSEEPAIFEDVSPAADSTVLRRLSAVPDDAKDAEAVHDDMPVWRSTCDMCLQSLPVGDMADILNSCCCTKLCNKCASKCWEHDSRCPLCRAPAFKSAAEWVRRMQKHVDEGNAEAHIMLGDAYREGAMDLKQSYKKAAQLFGRAAAQRHAFALASKNWDCASSAATAPRSIYKTAAMWFRRAAEQGLHIGQLSLGNMLYSGKGVAQSHAEAARWWRLSAKQDWPVALFALGQCHQVGEGVAKDLHESLRLHKRALAHGYYASAAEIERLEARQPT